MLALAWACFFLAAVPAVLICLNLGVARAPRSRVHRPCRVSVLIPARNEAHNIAGSVDSVLANRDADLELIVLDDDSSDGTSGIVEQHIRGDSRARLLRRQGPPPERCGKPHACQQLADEAGGELLIFIDADVRLSSDAIGSIAAELSNSDAALISGIPRQRTVSLPERLVIPLMEFVLYGFLPFGMMRRSTDPSLGAACGQLIAVKRDAYAAVGGHGAIAEHVHDGIALARRFRSCGYKTDVVDANRIAECRMYSNWSELLHGLAKNAHEGLGSPRGILPWTLILLMGQVLPYVALPFAWSSSGARSLLLGAIMLGLGSRAVLAIRFRHDWSSVPGHAAGIAVLVFIQWYSLYRRCLRRPLLWKGRELPPLHKRSVDAAEESCP